MLNSNFLIVCIFSMFLMTACTANQSIQKNDFKTIVDGLQIQTFGHVTKTESPIILVFLHGDSCKADYMKDTAALVVKKKVLSIVMARPGCEVSKRFSQGSHGNDDHYTEERIKAVTKANNSLKQHYKASKVFLIGHSGGAATAAIITGRNPNLVNGFVAVSFPANVAKWRIHRNRGKVWAKSLSPHNFINKIKPSTLIYIVNGSSDKNTPPFLSENYVNEATKRGLLIKNIILKGNTHNSSFKSYKVRSIISSFTSMK